MDHLLRILSQKFNKRFRWKYFATSHGKGAVDGIGGNANGLVHKTIMSKTNEVIVQSAEDFANVRGKIMKETWLIWYSLGGGAVERVHSFQDAHSWMRWWQSILVEKCPVKGDWHCWIKRRWWQITRGISYISGWRLGNCHIWRWWIPWWSNSNNWWRGEVSVMHPYGGYVKWPDKMDQIYYPIGNVLRKIDAPINARKLRTVYS